MSFLRISSAIMLASWMGLSTLSLLAQDSTIHMLDQQIEGPTNPEAFPAWIADIRH